MASHFPTVTEEQMLSIKDAIVPKNTNMARKFGKKVSFDFFGSLYSSCNFVCAKEHRAARFPLFVVCICCSIVRNKPNFGSVD